MYYITVSNSIRHREWDGRRLEIQRLLLPRSDSLYDIARYGGPQEGFRMLQQFTDPMYYQRPPVERVEIAITATLNTTFINITTPIQTILGSGIDLGWAYSYKNSGGDTLLHVTTHAFGQSVRRLVDLTTENETRSREWRKQAKAKLKGNFPHKPEHITKEY